MLSHNFGSFISALVGESDIIVWLIIGHALLFEGTQGAWDRFPGVSVVDVTQPAVDGEEQAVEWLRMIDEKGSRKYRERASETGQ